MRIPDVSDPPTAAVARSPSLFGGFVAVVALTLLAIMGSLTVSAFGGRLSWPLELCSHFRVQYFWVLAICCVVLAILRRRNAALVAAGFAAVNLALIVPLYFGPAVAGQPVAGQPVARAMSLNVYWLNGQHSRVLELIRAEKPDFVVLLEVTTAWREALDELRADYPYRSWVERDDPSGIVMLSRTPLYNLEVFSLSEAPTIIAELELPGGRLSVVATHPYSPGSELNLQMRNVQFEDLGPIVRSQKGPVMLLGDLNTSGWSPYFQDLLEHTRLVDSRYGFGVEATWPDLPRPLRIPIDHCLVSPGIGIVDRRVGPAVGSDHRPIVIDFVLPRR